MMEEELNRLGFKRVGQFYTTNNNLGYKLYSSEYATGVYIFLVDGKVKYVGETKRNLKTRMNGYKNPGPTQMTNQRIKDKLVEEIKRGKTVEIWFIPDSHIRSLKVILAGEKGRKEVVADAKLLERFIINGFTPEWNLN